MTSEQVETTHMIVRGIPPRLKGKIKRRVEKLDSSFNDVVVGILSDHFGLDFSPSGGRSSGVTENPNPVLRLPAELKRRIDYEAVERQDSQRNVVVAILADEFGEPFVATGRWIDRAATA